MLNEWSREPNHHDAEWHVVYIGGNDEDKDPISLHPESCPVWVGTKPDWSGRTLRYECGWSFELENVGFDSAFPDGLPAVGTWWRVRPWIRKITSISEPDDWDGGVEVEALEQEGSR